MDVDYIQENASKICLCLRIKHQLSKRDGHQGNPEIANPEPAQLPSSIPAPAGLAIPPGLVLPNPQPAVAQEAPQEVVTEQRDAPTDPRGYPPVPPTGLPEGWTQSQWDHYGLEVPRFDELR